MIWTFVLVWYALSLSALAIIAKWQHYVSLFDVLLSLGVALMVPIFVLIYLLARLCEMSPKMILWKRS